MYVIQPEAKPEENYYYYEKLNMGFIELLKQ